MVLRPMSSDLMATVHQPLCQHFRILNNIFGILPEFRSVRLFQRYRHGSNLMIMWSTLKRWEDCCINLVHKLPFSKNYTRSWSTKCLVSGTRYNICIFKGAVQALSRNKTRRVGHIHHKQCTNRVCDLSSALIIPFTRVSARTSNDQFWLKHFSPAFHIVIINVPSLVNRIGHAFEIYTGSRNLFALGCLKSMRQMTATG
mmetsp:Transcript_5040/g.7600  ORF Transcript_5040/g.7600 Transcript_5040/m.7600 type:complete len:200 (-) Transcript_5040:159-758(-)